MFADSRGACPYQPVLLRAAEEAPRLDAFRHGSRELPCTPRARLLTRASLLGSACLGAGLALGALLCAAAGLRFYGRLKAGQVGPQPSGRSQLRHMQDMQDMQDIGPFSGVKDVMAEIDRCPSSERLSDFSSKDRMEKSGWLFGWTGEDTFRPEKYLYASGISDTSYWGFSESVDGEIALVLKGHGFVTLDFGNSWGGDRSQVVVYLNGVPQSRAGAGTASVLVKVPFQDGDVLRLVEDNGIIVINSIFFDCTGLTVSKATPAPAATSIAASTTSAATTPIATSTTTAASTLTATSTLTSTATASFSSSSMDLVTFVASRTSSTTPTATSAMDPATINLKELKMSQVQALKRRTEEQKRSEAEMSARLARAAKQLEKLEEMEKRELLKAQREMQRKQELEKQLHEVNHEQE